MNCTTCPYQKQIDQLRRRCLACNPDGDGGSIRSKVRADEFTLNSVPKATGFDTTPSGMATNLSPEDEHKLRVAMSALFGLDPVELLLLQHLIHGRTLDEFGSVLDGISNQVLKHRGPARQMVWAKKRKILEKLPELAAVIKTDRENDTAKRVERELSRSTKHVVKAKVGVINI